MKNRIMKEQVRKGSDLKIPFDQKGIALIITMGMLVILTVIGLASMMTSSMEVRLAGNERTTAGSLYVADAGIEHALRALRGANFDQVVAAAQPWLTVTNFNGMNDVKYAVTVSKINAAHQTAPANSVFVKSVATFPDKTTKTVEAEVRNVSTQVPVNSAMGIAGNFSKIKLGGDATINGDLPLGEPPVAGSTCADNKAGVAVDTVNTFESIKVQKKAIHNITGDGITPSIQVRPSDMSPTMIQGLANQLAATADRTMTVTNNNDIRNGDNAWGTQANPQVTVITMQGDKAKLKFNGNTTGYGILIINSDVTKKGKVEFDGNFTWNGLIIITGDTKFDLKATGNTSITGGFVVANTVADPTEENVKLKTTGNTTLQYSCTVLTNAVNNSSLSINSWHEIL